LIANPAARQATAATWPGHEELRGGVARKLHCNFDRNEITVSG
jgi:hypothetical protein